MTQVVFVSDIVNPQTGLTIRQENERLTHKIPVGALVEVLKYNTDTDTHEEAFGLRLYVAEHTRDCDGTPLYTLSAQTQEEIDIARGVAKNSTILNGGMTLRGSTLIRPHLDGGYSEESLKVIKADHKGFWHKAGE